MSSLRFPDTMPGLLIKVERDVDYDVRVQTSLTRKELRYTYETYPLTHYRLGFEVLRSDSSLSLRARELQQALTHIARHYGQLDSFLLLDPADSSVTDHGFALGDGVTTAFQLQRTLAGDILDAYGEWPASTKPRTNLILRSQDLGNASWTKGTGVVVMSDAAVAPDGTPTADAVLYDGTGASGGIRLSQNTGVIPPAGSPVAVSIWLRADAPLTLVLKSNMSAIQSLSITTAWQRFSVLDVGGGGALLAAQLLSPAGVNTAFTVYAWGAQAEQASAVTRYIATTAAAVTSNPSYWPSYVDGYEPISDLNGPVALTVEADGLGKRPLSQLARTNLALQSEAFDNASWTKPANTSVTANVTTAPDGNVTADKLIESTTTSAEHYAEQSVAIAAGLPIANVVYAKAAERTWVYVSAVLRDAATVSGAYFDLTNGAIGTVETGVTASMVQGANGFWRCAIAVNVGAGGSNPRIRIQTASANGVKSYAGVVSSGLHLWGGQSEQAFVAGDYIATTTVTVSRTDFALSATGGIVCAVAPRALAQLAWTGSYWRRVRFEQQSVTVEQMVQSMWSCKALALVSVKT